MKVAILGSELTILDLFVTEFFACCKDAPVVLFKMPPDIRPDFISHVN